MLSVRRISNLHRSERRQTSEKMSWVALKKDVEEPWTMERVVRFIDLLGYGEITLKSDTEPAMVGCVQKSCC